MTELKTINDIEDKCLNNKHKKICLKTIKQASILVFKDILNHNKNPFKAFQTFHGVTDEEIAEEIGK